MSRRVVTATLTLAIIAPVLAADIPPSTAVEADEVVTYEDTLQIAACPAAASASK